MNRRESDAMASKPYAKKLISLLHAVDILCTEQIRFPGPHLSTWVSACLIVPGHHTHPHQQSFA